MAVIERARGKLENLKQRRQIGQYMIVRSYADILAVTLDA